MTKLKRTAAFTDIHWGKSNNSEIHNQDCTDFIDWFVEQVKKDPTIDSIAFLGDWYDNRAAINVLTMTLSRDAANKLSSLGLPIYFIIGNHDLYHRHTREVYSVVNFHDIPNFIVVNEPIVFDEFIKPALFCPYLFHNEYPSLVEHLNVNTWWGHFEFKGFVITGYNIQMQSGPDCTDFNGPNRIFSGHFHKRQSSGNVTYIGNPFPHSFADAGDNDRGMMIYDHEHDVTEFINWEECPKFQRVKMSDLVSNDALVIHPKARVRCLIDIPVTYEDSLLVKQEFMELYQLRDMTLEESDDINSALTDSTVDENEDSDDGESGDDSNNEAFDEMVVKMLQGVDTNQIDSNVLVDLYLKLK